MKKQTLFISLCAISALFITGCANSRLAAVHSVTVDSNVARPKKLEYADQASQNAGALGVLFIGALPGALIQKGMSAGPRKEIEGTAASKEIAIEKIVPAVFADELSRSGLFTVNQQGGGDATVHLKVPAYQLIHKSGMFGRPTLAPGVVIEAQFAGSNGRNFYGIGKGGYAAKENWHTQAEYKENPELLRAGWEEAARVTTRAIIAQIRKKMPK